MATNIITRGGHDALKAELDHLWRVYRPEITQKVTWAASLGDRSENADYQYNKKLLREIDRRVDIYANAWRTSGSSTIPPSRRERCFSEPG